jgi:soluble lytic murein transglycosylase-like protein
MHDLSTTYVHYGDRQRRRRKVRAGVIFIGFFAASVTAARDWRPDAARAAVVSRDSLDLARQSDADTSDGYWSTGENLERWNRVFAFARQYGIKAELAAAIHDEAVRQKVDPDLAFRLVRLESRFNERAKSPVGAIGLTQLMPPTARHYEPDVTIEGLYDRHTNLRIGFNYLYDLLKQYRSVRTALLVYNRGPLAVLIEKELGIDPSNGYDQIVLKGYRGNGLLKEQGASD